MKERNKPTADELDDRFKAYEKFYRNLHQEQKDIDDYYELVYDADVPSRYETRMPSTARDWIDVGVRHFTLDNPKSRVFQRNDTQTARDQVLILETFYDFWLRKERGTIKDIAKKLLLRGEAFIKVNLDDVYFGSTDEERLFYFPLYLTNPDAINVYASPAHIGHIPDDVFEEFKITVAEAKALCERNGWDWDTDKAPDKLVTWRSYYNSHWRCFWLDKETVLDVQPNILGFCPYVHIGSGHGQTSYEGKPEYNYRSLLWPRKDMLKMEARVLSQIDAINARYAWVRYKVRGDPDTIKQLYPEGVPTDPAELLYEVPDRVEIEMLQGEQPPQGLYQQQAMIQGYSHPPAVLSGIRPSGVYSGQHQETLMATAKPIYKDAFQNLEEGLAITMGLGARVIERVYNSPLEIKNFASDSERMYRRITPKDISGHYDCEVQLLAEPPEATDIRKGLGKALRQGGSISHITELKEYQDMSQKEAEDEIAQMAAENALAEPAVREVVARNAMMRMGMDRELEILNEAQQSGVKPVPPVRQGEMNMGTEMARQRGRVTPEMGPMPTPHETEVM